MDLRALERIRMEWIADFDRFKNIGELREEPVICALMHVYS